LRVDNRRKAPRDLIRPQEPAWRSLQQRNADLERLAQTQHPRRSRKCLEENIAVERVPARALEDIRSARMPGERVTQRTQRTDEITSRPGLWRSQDLIDRRWFGVHDEPTLLLQQLRHES